MFERVEVKPQALEWLFSEAAGVKFRVSADNLANPNVALSETFKIAVARQARQYLLSGLPARAARYFRALQDAFGTDTSSMRVNRYDASNLN